jgi:hypothetical protein
LDRLFRPKAAASLSGWSHWKPTSSVCDFFVRVFDLELGQRGAAVKTPVDGLEAAIDKTAFHDAFERADLVGFVAGVHGQVGVGPFTEHAKAFEVFFLLRDLLGRKGAALGLHVVS